MFDKAASGIPSSVPKVGLSRTSDAGYEPGVRRQRTAGVARHLGLVWINSSYPVVAAGLARALEGHASVHLGPEAPADLPSCAIIDVGSARDLSGSIRYIQELNSDIPSLIFSLHLDLRLAKAAFQAGARGFIHARMQPAQIVRAIEVTQKGQLAAPRQLLEYLLAYDESTGLDALGSRQREILGHLAVGLSNAEIAKRLYLSESTIKQHLRHTYKILGVSNRTEAVNLFRKAEGS